MVWLLYYIESTNTNNGSCHEIFGVVDRSGLCLYGKADGLVLFFTFVTKFQFCILISFCLRLGAEVLEVEDSNSDGDKHSSEMRNFSYSCHGLIVTRNDFSVQVDLNKIFINSLNALRNLTMKQCVLIRKLRTKAF